MSIGVDVVPIPVLVGGCDNRRLQFEIIVNSYVFEHDAIQDGPIIYVLEYNKSTATRNATT
jgi:hypothetical protein